MTPGGPRVLLVATATEWLGTARVPRAFVRAGWSVALFAPRGTLALASRALERWFPLPDDAHAARWSAVFADAMDAWTPDLVAPCDERAFALLAAFERRPPPGIAAGRAASIAASIRRSLGDPAHYAASVDKHALPGAARAFGVPMPESLVVGSPEEAARFGERVGWPLVLKRPDGYAGLGVAIVPSRASLAGAWAELARPTLASAEPGRPARLLAQRAIDGAIWYVVVAAWEGRWLAGWGAERLVGHPEPKGPGTVMHHRHRADIEAHARAIVAGFGMSGLFGLEFMVDRADRAWLIEVNRRITPGVPKGDLIGVDVVGALTAAMRGDPGPPCARLPADEATIVVNFPQEWLRDPSSRWLDDHRVDAPWDDPGLFAAMLARRHA